MKAWPFLFLLALLTFAQCKSGKKALKQGNYETAVFDALDRLKKAPNNDNARETLAKAYPALVNYYLDLNQRALASSDVLKWDRIYDNYEALSAVYDEVLRTPAAQDVITPTDYTNEKEQAKTKLIEARYRLGTAELAKGYRENAKIAYDHFLRIYTLDPTYRDAEDKMYEAQSAATIYVEVMPIPMQRAYSLSCDFFQNQILEFARAENLSPFVQFVSSVEAKNQNLRIDQILLMEFDDFVVGNAYEKETVNHQTKDSVIIGTTKLADSTVNVYGTVKAEVHTFRRTISSNGTLDLRILNKADQGVLTQRKFTGVFEYVDEWGYYHGDERALDKKEKDICKRNKPLVNPLPNDLFIQFTKPIFDQVTRYIRDYYKEI
ncbi:MAG: hypothetical protein KDC57_01365 [Saprospiraceae bacterium]|nr:hypothetical protein [Saprospiraceae bacterium]